MKANTTIVFLLGFAIGILFGAYALKWAASHRSSPTNAVVPAPHSLPYTLAQMRSNLPVPDLPLMVATGLAEEVTERARIRDEYTQPIHNDSPIFGVRSPKQPLAQLWPMIKKYI